MIRCPFCHRIVWPGQAMNTMGIPNGRRRRIHAACFEELFEKAWAVAHPKLHDGWTQAQIDSMYTQIIQDSLP